MKKRIVYGIIPIFFLLGLGEGPHDRNAEVSVSKGSQVEKRTSFSFGLIGDLPYSSREEEQFPYLIQELNLSPLTFVVHVGDMKGGGSRCDDTVYVKRLKEFQGSRHPFILIPGDNDWTDCHRTSNGGFDPKERLAFLRKVFFSTKGSLGQTPIPLVRQSQNGDYRAFVENVRWSIGGVLFIGLHVVGSNNNLGRTLKADREYRHRNQANLAWLRESFQIALVGQYQGVMIFIHGNPFEPDPDFPGKSGFRDFLKDLELEARQFGRPVAIVHGDTHNFRVDKPLPRSGDEPRLMSFTRVEVFGSPNVQWIRGRVDSTIPNLFSFEPMKFPWKKTGNLP